MNDGGAGGGEGADGTGAALICAGGALSPTTFPLNAAPLLSTVFAFLSAAPPLIEFISAFTSAGPAEGVITTGALGAAGAGGGGGAPGAGGGVLPTAGVD